MTSKIEDEKYRASLLQGYGPILEELERRGIQVTFQEYDSQETGDTTSHLTHLPPDTLHVNIERESM